MQWVTIHGTGHDSARMLASFASRVMRDKGYSRDMQRAISEDLLGRTGNDLVSRFREHFPRGSKVGLYIIY